MEKRNKNQIKRNRKGKIIKDKTIINFILQHSKKEVIDFSKIKIPSFLDCLNEEEEHSNKLIKKYPNKKNKEELNCKANKRLPMFGLSLLGTFTNSENTHSNVGFSSLLFQ